jgi:hypothetical protein
MSQKQKNVTELRRAAACAGYSPVLEVSTKAKSKLGRHLSAFHLKVQGKQGLIPLESAYQGSKVFESGGPFMDLYFAEPRVAKRDSRLRASGRLLSFEFDGLRFPVEPVTAFYDWLYVGSVYPHREWLTRLYRYAAFSDIEFNPRRSISCQARSCALFVALMSKGILNEAVKSPDAFLTTLRSHAYGQVQTDGSGQGDLIPDRPLDARSRRARSAREKRGGAQ